MRREGWQRLPLAPGTDGYREITWIAVLPLHEWEGGMDPTQGSTEGCCVGFKAKDGGASLSNDLEDWGEGVWSKLEENVNQLIRKGTEAPRLDL